MKKALAFILCAVMASAFAGCGSGSTETSSTAATEAQTTEAQATEAQATVEPLSEDTKKQLDSALSEANFNGVAQITRGGSVIYQYAEGNDDNGNPLTIDASMPVGSVSKQFCAAAVMLLCENNRLSVDDKLDKYYPDYKYGDKITIKNLLNMSSGIPSYYMAIIRGDMLSANEEENVKTIKDAIFGEELDFDPGNGYDYSNSNYFLLADIVEQVSKTSYHDYIRKSFLEPLQMKNTGFVEEISGGYEWTSALSKTEVMDETACPGFVKGAGDIVTNAEDMDKWMHGLSGGTVISPDSLRQMTETINPDSAEDYGYGLFHMPYDGVGHTGQIPPHFGAVDYFNTTDDVYLFAAANTPPGMSFVEQLPEALLSILLGDEE